MNEFLWMCVSPDSLELPMMAAGSAGELAVMSGVSERQILDAARTHKTVRVGDVDGLCKIKKIFLGPYTEGSSYVEDTRLAREAAMCDF